MLMTFITIMMIMTYPMMQRLMMFSLRHSLMFSRVSTAAGGRH